MQSNLLGMLISLWTILVALFVHYWKCYSGQEFCHTCPYQLLSLLHVPVLSLGLPWLVCQNKYFPFCIHYTSGVQYLFLAMTHKEHVLLFQRVGQQRRDLILYGLLVKKRVRISK